MHDDSWSCSKDAESWSCHLVYLTHDWQESYDDLLLELGLLPDEVFLSSHVSGRRLFTFVLQELFTHNPKDPESLPEMVESQTNYRTQMITE